MRFQRFLAARILQLRIGHRDQGCPQVRHTITAIPVHSSSMSIRTQLIYKYSSFISSVVAVITVLTLCTATPAQASESDYVSAGETSIALAGLDEPLLLEPSDDAGLGRVELNESTVIHIPADPTAGIDIESGLLGVSISLPGSGDADRGVVLADGTVTYPGNNFSNSVIASEAGVQFLTTIAGQDAPTRFEYEVDLPRGATLKETGGGTATVFDNRGNAMMMLLPAWARDASGSELPTHYVLEGQTLIQYVDHRQEGVTYPVVADPRFEWWGLLPTVKLTRSETYKMRYSAMPAKLSLCVSLGGVAGVALAVPCAVSLAVLSVKAGMIYASGRCLRVVIGPGILGGVDYKDSYCK